MEDRQTIFAKVVRAVQTINSAAASHLDRAEAQQYIERVKAQLGPALGEFGFAYAEARTQSDYVQHLGYHFLEHVLNNHWNAMAAEDRAKLRAMVVRLLQTSPDTAAPLFQEKTAQLLAEVAKREWPQRWPEFYDLLVAAMQESDCKAEIVLRTLRTLAEDTLASPFATKPPKSNSGSKWDVIVLSADRRKDLLLALRGLQEPLLTLLACFMQAKYSALAAEPPQREVAARLVNLVQSLLTALMEIINAEALFKYRFPLMWVTLMAEQEPCRMVTAQCVVEFVGETVKGGPAAADFAPFCTMLCDFVTQFTGGALEAVDGVRPHVEAVRQAHAFHQLLARIVNALGSFNWKAIQQSNLVQRYLGTCMALLQHPSLTISETIFDLLNTLLHEESFRESPEYRDTLHTFLPLIKTKITKSVGDLDYTPPLPVTVYSQYDFDSSEEYSQCMGLIRSKACQALALTTGVQPGACLQFVAWVSEELLRACPKPSPSDPRNAYGNVSQRSQTFLQWESTSWVICTILDQVGSCDRGVAQTILNDSVKSFLMPVANKWLECTPQDGALIPVYLSIVAAFLPLFLAAAAPAGPLRALMGKLFHYMTYRRVGELDHLCEDTRAARKKAHSTFIRLATRIPELLVPYLEMIVTHTKALMQNGVLLDMEVSFLFEAMAAISNQLSGNDQTAFFESILTPAATSWVQQVQNVVQDGAGFVQACGLAAGPDQPRHHLHEVQHHLNIFVGMYRRATPPPAPAHSLGRVADQILPPLVQLVARLHALQDPAGLLPLIPPTSLPLLGLSAAEEVTLLGKLASHKNRKSVPSSVYAIRLTLSNLRVSCYTLLGLLTLFSPSLYNQAREVVRRYVLAPALHHVDDLPLKHLLQHFLSPFVLHCPVEHFSVLALILPPLHQFLFERLAARWANLQQRLAPSGTVDLDETLEEDEVDASMVDELMERRALRGVALQCLETIKEVAAGLAEKSAPKEKEDQRSRQRRQQMAAFILGDEALANSTLMLVTAALLWPDAQCAAKAVHAAGRLLPALARDARFDQQLYCLMGTGLQRLLSMSQPSSATMSPAGATSAAQEAASKMYRTSQEDSLIHDLGTLLCDIYCLKYPSSPIFSHLWVQLGMSPAQIQELHASLQKPAEKARRAVFHSLVANLVGRNVQAQPDHRVILHLPRYEARNRPAPATSWLEHEGPCLQLLL